MLYCLECEKHQNEFYLVQVLTTESICNLYRLEKQEPKRKSKQFNYTELLNKSRGWSGGAMVPGKLPVPGCPTILITVGQGPTALAVGAGGGCLDIFTLIYPFLFSFSLSLGDGPI